MASLDPLLDLMVTPGEANRRFERRFRYIEAALAERGKGLAQSNPAEMETLWPQANMQERSSGWPVSGGPRCVTARRASAAMNAFAPGGFPRIK